MDKERRRRWSFYTREDGSWLWRVLHGDGNEASSQRSFDNIKDCIADAKMHGYVVWEPSSERRVTVTPQT
ncbi:MAG: hypothetical protein ACXWCY_13875 [Burkholderiales bacterium]|jgi:hypothetical protein